VDLKKLDRVVSASTTILHELANFADKISPAIHELVKETENEQETDETEPEDPAPEIS